MGKTHSTRDMCFPGGGGMCISGRGTLILIAGNCSWVGKKYYTRDMCLPGRGTHLQHMLTTLKMVTSKT